MKVKLNGRWKMLAPCFTDKKPAQNQRANAERFCAGL